MQGVLHEILELLKTPDDKINEQIQSILIPYFESYREKNSPEALKVLIRQLRSQYGENTPAALFLDRALEACHLLEQPPLPQVWDRVLRSVSGSYLYDGTVARCPKCHSTHVHEGENSAYYFTDMVCADCGYRELADDYQLEDWYPL